MRKKTFNAAVIGAGPAGAIAAYVLARAGRRVILYDRPKRPARKAGESLPAAVRPLLRHLDLLHVVEDGGHLLAHGNYTSWGGSKLNLTDFSEDPHGLGWHLDRMKFERDLLHAALEAGVVYCEQQIHSAQELDADWILDTSGRNSLLARDFGVQRLRDDDLTAVYGWYKIKLHDFDSRTLLEATKYGWWYSARLPDRTRIVAFHTDAKTAAHLFRTPELWRDLIDNSRYIRKLSLRTDPLGGLHLGEASGSRLERFSGPGWLAAGDCALTFDPLSSQGLFNAIYTGMKAGQAVHATLCGDPMAITNYTSRLEQIRAKYLAHHYSYYAIEQRWAQAPFWRSRMPAMPYGSGRDAIA